MVWGKGWGVFLSASAFSAASVYGADPVSLPLLGASTSTVSTRPARAPVALGAQIGIQTGVPDLRDRRDPQTDIFGEAVSRGADPYRLMTYSFSLDVALVQRERHDFWLQAVLPFRTAAGGNQNSPGGSEFGGFEFALFNRFAQRLTWELSYAQRFSEIFRLLSRHFELASALYVEFSDAGADAPGFHLKLGPEIAYTQTLGDDARDAYGLQSGFYALLRLQTQDPVGFPMALGLETHFQRISSFEVADRNEGGAGLLTLSPQIEYMLVPGLWLGAQMHFPVLRPQGREEAFSNPALPGLYGNSFGLVLRM